MAIFSQANEGDSSPNTAGPRCIDTGEPCDFVQSTCNGKVSTSIPVTTPTDCYSLSLQNEKCIAFGPGKDMFESTAIIAKKQYSKAKELFVGNGTKVSGDIQFIYQNIDMSHYEVKLSDNQTVTTCKPALGFAFAAGTTDGEGAPMV